MIMLTSAQRLPQGRARARRGSAQWLTKPVRSSELYERLVRLLSPASRRTREAPRPARRRPRRSRPPRAGRVLVVEDNAFNQLVAAGLVARLGFEVDTVGNGAEALDARRADRVRRRS